MRLKLEKAGFTVERITGFVSLLFPFMLASRLLSKMHKGNKAVVKKRNEKKKQLDELHLPSWLNGIFSFVMKIEFWLLRMGIHFPFGGSIIAVVRK